MRTVTRCKWFPLAYGAGVWTGHPIELVVVLGILLIALIGIPESRWFFGATVLVGSVAGYLLWRRNQLRA